MDELKAAVASNLIRLRTQAGYTQAELGQLVNYSDKTVSKWERAESIPDALVLRQLAGLYGVTVDALLTPQDTWKDAQPPARIQYNLKSIFMVSIAGIWTLALLAFVVLWIMGDVVWQIFVFSVPASLITFLVLHSALGSGKYNVYIVMALVLSGFVVTYLTLLRYNPWQLFLVAVPAELVVWFGFHIRVTEDDKKVTKTR